MNIFRAAYRLLSNPRLMVLWLAWPALSAAAPLHGVVRGPDNQPLAGITVRHLTASATDAAVTTSDGRFQLDSPVPGPVILEITGRSGTGRVRAVAGTDEPPLELRYPVIEHIVLMHSNDHHFDFNARDRFQAELEAARSQYEDVFYLNAGDIFVWRPLAWRVRRAGAPEQRVGPDWYAQRAMEMIGILNDAGCAAMTLGNHELAYVGRHTGAALARADFPLLGANLALDTDALPPIQPFTILRTGTDRTIAVLGLTLDTSRMQGVKQLPVFETAAQYMHLRQTNDLLVALTHIGLAQDLQLAEKFPELDVIIGGHSHEPRVDNTGPVLVVGARGVLHTVSCDRNPNSLGRVIVTLENGQVRDKTGEIMIFEPGP